MGRRGERGRGEESGKGGRERREWDRRRNRWKHDEGQRDKNEVKAEMA